MAAGSLKSSFVLFFACSLFLQVALGEIICEKLPTEQCSFSISSSGKRCLLENSAGNVEFQCRTSEVVVERMAEHIETQECVDACGVDRKSVGISSDAFFEPQFTSKLCSPQCYKNCPNIVDLYFNLAAAEGVYLPTLCEKQRRNPHRALVELVSNGAAASGPEASDALDMTAVIASAPSPSF